MVNKLKLCKNCGIEFLAKDKIVHCEICRSPYGREDRGLKDILDSLPLKEQSKTLERWANEKLANGHKLRILITKLYTLRKFANQFNKPFEKVGKDDIIKLLAQKEFNRVYYKKLLKQFFRWLYGEDNPELIKWIQVKKTLEETAPEKKVLTDEELLRIINCATNQRDRTMLQIISENPTRPKDICNLRIRDVHTDEYGFELQLGSKTPKGRRTIRLINSVPDLRQYLQTHPFRDNPDAPLFYQISTNRFGEPVGWSAMNGCLQKAVKLAQVKRKVTLYDFRRTTATTLLRNPNYTPSEVQVMGGWSSIRMLDVYGRVTSEMVNQKKLQVSGLVKTEKQLQEDLLKPIKCPRCETDNPSTAVACGNCWLPLKKQAIAVKEKVIKKAIQWQKPLTKEGVREILRQMKLEGEL